MVVQRITVRLGVTAAFMALSSGGAWAQPRPAPHPPASAAPPGSATASAAPGRVAGAAGYSLVSIETTDPRVALDRRVSLSDTGYWESEWERVCVTPCRLPVRVDRWYRIAGEGVAPSEEFTLAPSASQTLTVHAGSSSARGAGQYMTLGGVMFAAGGGLALALGASAKRSPSETTRDVDHTLTWLGVGALVGGAALLLAGIPLWALNGTRVESPAGRTLARAAPAR